MANSIKSYSLSSARFSHNFVPYINVKTEMDYGFQHSQHHIYSQGEEPMYSSSPHSLSSCMYASNMTSPCMPSRTPDNCVSAIGSSKENNGVSRSAPSCRRRLDFNHNACMDSAKAAPVAVAKRNERERNRVKLINMTFQTLRQHLPLTSSGTKGKSRKLSKVQTLRSAIDYIRQLQDLVSTRQLLDKHHKQGSQCNSKMVLSPEAKNSVSKNNGDISPSVKTETPRGYIVCQTPYRTLGSFSSVDMSNDNILSPQIHGDLVSSRSAANSESPSSDSSCYDQVTTPEDEEFIDFDDWF